MRARYVNCLTHTWKSDQMYKGQDWIAVNSVFISWMQSTKLKANLLTMQGYQTKKKISIPLEQHPHFENHLSLLQDIGSDDDHMDYESFIEICNVCRNFMKNSNLCSSLLYC
jgi:hypothetical protein